ncbi:molybdenum cofactor guanylyltransferase, partial [Streptomyces sp. SID2119]|nr:molybdenum cofactor guanylyltransferase [Streptomyces sp. SID2119]
EAARRATALALRWEAEADAEGGGAEKGARPEASGEQAGTP